MKKITAFIILSLLITAPAYASYNEGRTEMNYFKRVGTMEGRGILNILGFPLEITGTAWNEMQKHHWLWPVTVIPRWFMNGTVRGASIANDVLLSPFSQMFTNDISAYTEHFDLPDYPWETREESI